MSRLIYQMSVSLDGFVALPDGSQPFVHVDDEIHAFFNDEARKVDTMLHGRRMYELMSSFWPTADQDPAAPDVYKDFARIWRDKPKVVFSRTLDHVDWNTRLVRDDPAGEVRAMKAKGMTMDVGGPDIASALIREDLVDEFAVFVNPAVVGRGKAFFPPLERTLDLRLVETRQFAGGVVFLRYERAR